ncbi:MAG: peptidoglycan-associated lipoprotein Pal [bacterium]|nr:peptidoglycan-associated lipoprotein Pal [bacterium]
MKKSSLVSIITIVLFGALLIISTGCGPKPKPQKVEPTINLDSLRAAEEAKRRADSIAAAEARRRAEEEARRKAEEERLRAEREQEAKDKASLKIIYFDFDKSNIRNDMTSDVSYNAGLFKKYSKWTVTLEGHADERGTNEYNLALGERRAKSVRDFLVNYGIDANRISVMSYGEERPAVKGTGEAAWSKNRRVEFNTR